MTFQRTLSTRAALLVLLLLPLPAGAQTIVRSFDGDKGPDLEHCDPAMMRCGRQPEPNAAVNGTRIAQVTWQHFSVYDYSGKLLRATPIAKFITDAGLVAMPDAPKSPAQGPFEPHVVFDELIGRWVMTVTCLNDCLLVSATADPLGAWHGVYLACLAGGPCLPGDPGLHIGYDKNGLYYCGAHLGEEHPLTVPKVAYDCLAVPSEEVKAIGTGKEPQHVNRMHSMPLDILPAVDHNPNKAPNAPALFAAKTCNRSIQGGCQFSDNFSFSWLIDTFTWNGPTGTFNAAGEQTVQTGVGSKQNTWLYNYPCCGPLATLAQKGSDIGLRGAESHRLINLVQEGSHLYGSMGSGPCTHDCGAQGADTNNVMFYVDFDCTKPSACVVAQTAKISSADANPIFGTVGVDENGNIGITAISSTASTNMSVLLWTRKKSDPPNTFKGPMTVVEGTQPYTCRTANPNTASMALIANAVGILTLRDPLDGTKLWTTQQYGGDSTPCAWNTRIIEYEVK